MVNPAVVIYVERDMDIPVCRRPRQSGGGKAPDQGSGYLMRCLTTMTASAASFLCGLEHLSKSADLGN